jgi:hypothetical protein
VDFNQFLEQALLRDVMIQQPGYYILRRRIAILLGQWTPVMTTEGLNRRVVYQIFQQVLNPEDQLNTQVVRVAAGMQLKNVIEPFEFDVNEFLEYAPSILRSIIHLLFQADTAEVKMGLLDTLRILTSKMEIHVRITLEANFKY